MADQNDRHGRPERIAKVIARAGLASRREAERWISAGRVMVNGAVIDSPAVDVTTRDSIAVDGHALPVRERTRLFLFHKPRGLLTSHADPQGRPTIFATLPRRLPRLISVGRLDLNSEGLLLLTNDGSLARVLELPTTGWLRRYRVRAHGRITQEQLDRLRDGIVIDRIRYGPIEAAADRRQGANVWLTFAMREGKNREVKNVLGHLGLAVNRLIRVSFGPFQLGDLAPGEIEEVRTRTLREQLGSRVAALTAADFSGPRTEWKGASVSTGGGAPQMRAVATSGKAPRPGLESSEGRSRRPPRDKPVKRNKIRSAEFGPVGEPERARREKRHGRRASRSKRR